jgi:hypothetical protein
LALANQIPKATKGTGTITCTTYSGSTAVGSTTANFKVTVPDSVVPTIDSVSVSEGTEGLANQFGCYVQGKSTLNVKVSASGAYESTIKSYSSKLQKVTYTGKSFTTNALTASDVLDLVVTVTDSRGRTAKKAVSVTVVAYSAPSITAFSVQRCDASGTADDSGDYAKITYSYAVSSVSKKNTCSAKIEYKQSSATSWAGTLATSTAYSKSTSVVPITVLSSENQWDIRLTVTDYFSSATYTAILPSAAVIMDFLADGTGMGIGQVSEKSGTLQVGMDAEFNGDVWGAALGLGLLPSLASIGDLNSLLTVGCYSIRTTATAKTIDNLPEATPGVVYVQNSGGKDLETSDYLWLKQIYMPYNSTTIFCYARNITKSGANASYTYGAWKTVKYS